MALFFIAYVVAIPDESTAYSEALSVMESSSTSEDVVGWFF